MIIRSAVIRAHIMSWVMVIDEILYLFFVRIINSLISLEVPVSNPVVGSSYNISSGRKISVLANPIRLFCPPDSFDGN